MKSQVEKEKATLAREKKERPYGSWDPFTQAKYIYEINKAVGNRQITRKEAYETAVELVKESPLDPKFQD